jgi:hypothetical protein
VVALSCVCRFAMRCTISAVHEGIKRSVFIKKRRVRNDCADQAVYQETAREK